MANDHWDSSLYEDRHSFVWKAGGDLVELLHPEAAQRILDLGCGTGQLTAKIAETGATVIGIDSSPSMVAQARQNYPLLTFALADARSFRFKEEFDAVFSNAVLHWIPEADKVIQCVAAALRPHGRFVLEMGAKHNVERIQTALESTLWAQGIKFEPIWFYPSVAEYAALLEQHGFEIAYATTFPRWSRLEHPERGLREWIEMFAKNYFKDAPPEDVPALMEEMETKLRPALYRDGSWWADYRRLRIVASLETKSPSRES